MTNSLSDRTYLFNRHRLSHQQIDRWLGENRSKEFVQEKLKQLDAVKNFLSVTDLLTQNGISFICIKGPLLSNRIYGDPTVRLSHDIDILIETAVIEPVMKILFQNGYHLTTGSIWPLKKAQQELLIDVIHHLSFYNQQLYLCVEVHWVLMHELPISSKKQKELIAGNLTEVDFAGRNFTVLTKEFELLFLIIHGAKHGWNRLKWLVDIHMYPLNKINNARFDQLVKELKAGRMIGQINFLLSKFFNTPLPFTSDKHTPRYLLQYSIQSIDSEIPLQLSLRDYISSFRNQYLMYPGHYYKYKMIARVFFRPLDIELIDSSFKIVYYLYRPYSLIIRRLFHVR